MCTHGRVLSECVLCRCWRLGRPCTAASLGQAQQADLRAQQARQAHQALMTRRAETT